MKIVKRLSIVFALFFVFSVTAKAQGDVTALLSQNLNDANKLANAYLEPFGKGFGTSLNSGWYTTAKPHKLFGFDLTFSVAASMVPSGDKKFDVSKLNLEYWNLQDPNKNMSPTVAGSKIDGPVLENGINTLTLPQGAGLSFVPAPMIQAGIGLPFNTEIDFRYLPTLNVSDGKFGLWGFGIKNEFKEFIPVFKAMPFNVSIFYGYTNFKSSFDAKQSGNEKSNQKLEFNAKGYTTKLLISKSIPVLTVYAGVGYSKSTTNVDLKGDYTVPGVGAKTDPLSLEFVNKGMTANIGLRIKLAVIAFHFDYTLGDYKIYNAGFGINFR